LLIEVPDKVAKMTVIKRDGKKVEFNGAKIALAIQKGFWDITGNEDVLNAKYNETDINKVYSKVLGRIEKREAEKIKIEEIQDLIEEELKNSGYQDVYEAFSSYREKRTQSRQLFFDEKKQHKFLKALEDLGLKTANGDENKNRQTSMETMLQYGSTISRQFAITYLMKKKFAQAHENGDIYIHDMDFLPMGTTTCCQIDFSKLYENGFTVGEEKLQTPQNIMGYILLALLAIQANQNDQHGEQSVPAFDYYMAPGILKTFKQKLKQIIFDYLELTDFDKFIAINGIEREIEKINTIQIESNVFDKYCRKSEELKRLFRISYQKAIQQTNIAAYQAMQFLVKQLNTIHSKTGAQISKTSINLGTDITPEGRTITKNILTVLKIASENHNCYNFPIVIFKVKEGINTKKGEPNYDLLELACEACCKGAHIHFSFLDTTFNKKYYQKGMYQTEVAYMNCYVRTLENMVDTNKSISTGRGSLSCTSINLPRIGIKYGIISNQKVNLKAFFIELEEKIDLVKDQLLERFEVQCKKKPFHFPFLLGQGVWIDSEKLKDTDNLKKVLKQGNLNIGFIGLEECLKALTGKYQEESEETHKLGIKIVKFMREKCDEYSKKYNLNFTLIGTSEEQLAGKFIKLDQAIYGKLSGITDKESYTNSFHVQLRAKITVLRKIELEAPYHGLTNGGHITVVEENGDYMDYMKIIQMMKKMQIGYATIKKNMKGSEKI
jgi:anaerobic ribonucleoside-triphosphate reductase